MAETLQDHLREQVSLLPLSPGVYQFLDRSGTIIYVGKAKSLRKRVSSYFVQSKEHSAKVRALVRQIAEIRHIVVGSETDALLLENSLIKTLQPRYNILLKDDKTYPWIVVRRERFPRVQSTRQVVRDGSQYFGPYGSVMMQHSVLEFVREVVPLRTCKLDLSPAKIARGKYTVCLQYHLGNCKGPCVGLQSEEEYARQVELVVSVLKGDLRPVRQYLTGEMERAAAELRFEAAQRYKQRLDALDNYAGRSVIVSARIVDVDVFSLLEDDDVAYCNFTRIRHGSIVGVYTVRLTAGVGGDPRDMLTLAIQHVVEQVADGKLAREVIVPFLPSTTLLFDGANLHRAQAGREARPAGILAEERPHLPGRAAQEPRDQESRTSYGAADGGAVQGAEPRSAAAPHRVFPTTRTFRARIPWRRASSSATASLRARSTAISISRPWRAPTTMPRCARWSSAVTAVCRPKGPSCPI